MKLLLTLFLISWLNLFQTGKASAQSPAKKQLSRDTTPIEYLDFHLTKSEFIYYYGTDDTARAVINMFYRKRGVALVDFCVVPILSSAAGDIMIAVGAIGLTFGSVLGGPTEGAVALVAIGAATYVVGFFGVPILYIIRRTIYTRQKLLYILVSRERGQGLPPEIIDNLWQSDFQ